MKHKRFLAGLLCAALLLLLLPSVLAAGGPALSLSSAQADPGGELTLTLSVQNNPGLGAFLVYFYYDTAVFTADADSDIAATGSFKTGSLVGNSVDEDGKTGVLALWYTGASTGVTADGEALTLKLRVSSTAKSGVYPVELSYSPQNTIGPDLKPVSFTTTSATVTVGNVTTADPQPTATPTPTETQSPTPSETESPAPSQTESPTPTETETPSPAPTTTPDTPETGTDADTPQISDTAGHWAESYITEAASLGLVIGNEGLFRPDDSMTRAEFVTILWRMSGSPAPSGKASFTDLPLNWYQDAIAWAEETGVVNGVGNGRFSPQGNVTRQQVATTLYRLSGSNTGMEALFTSLYDAQYPDSGDLGAWAKSAVYWAIYNEIYCGQSSVSVGATLTPKLPATRAQIAVMVVNYETEQ
jgi:hypothetical protein